GWPGSRRRRVALAALVRARFVVGVKVGLAPLSCPGLSSALASQSSELAHLLQSVCRHRVLLRWRRLVLRDVGLLLGLRQHKQLRIVLHTAQAILRSRTEDLDNVTL